MLSEQTKALNEDVFDRLATLPRLAADPVTLFTLEKMYRYRHIPLRYYLPGPDAKHLPALAEAIARDGYLDLDTDHNFCVLSGKPSIYEQKTKNRKD